MKSDSSTFTCPYNLEQHSVIQCFGCVDMNVALWQLCSACGPGGKKGSRMANWNKIGKMKGENRTVWSKLGQ
nr:hypothetical protein [Tanacetum cinerariifolium]